MKKSLIILTVLVITGCHEDEKIGSCFGCRKTNGCSDACYNNISEDDCNEYNKNKLDSMNWSLSDGKLPCLDQLPDPDGN